jgi:hypothetical protein
MYEQNVTLASSRLLLFVAYPDKDNTVHQLVTKIRDTVQLGDQELATARNA